MPDDLSPAFPSGPDLTACDREPIHIPGSIQPHGLLLVVDRDDLTVTHTAGDVGLLAGGDPRGRALGEALGDEIAARAARLTDSGGVGGLAGQTSSAAGGVLDITASQSGDYILVELEPAAAQVHSAAVVLGDMARAAAAFERASNLRSLCERAATEFRRMTGFDRVMIYQFIDEGAGVVLAEDKREDLPTFLNHYFPGSDIPRQARALCVRNLVRVIPDIGYTPAPLVPAWTDGAPLDMSDCALRSVSPVHMQYMKNMGVGASASISIVRDGVLWGLIACHHMSPRLLPYDLRVACATLAGGLARQIKAKEDAETYRQRLRLRGAEDDLVIQLGRGVGEEMIAAADLPLLASVLEADGVAVLRGERLIANGSRPGDNQVRDLARWALDQASLGALATDRLGEVFPAAKAYARDASGLLASVVSTDEPFVILWFRAERVEVVKWAGDPHKDMALKPGETLTPRASFEAWSETVHGRSRRWTAAEVDSAGRLRSALLDLRQSHRLRELNLRLSQSVGEKDQLLGQKELLLREVNHRIQNSLQLVGGFLMLQSREHEDPTLRAALEEARRRLGAVAMVHRRLYRGDSIETVDLARYVEDLVADMLQTMGPEWADLIGLDLAPVTVDNDQAVSVGLIATELVINANKYAYDGAPGAIEITLEEGPDGFRLVVADRGKGRHQPRPGFGTRMITGLVTQLGGELDYRDNNPGLRAVLTAPLKRPGT